MNGIYYGRLGRLKVVGRAGDGRIVLLSIKPDS
jgi:hypothetical protein